MFEAHEKIPESRPGDRTRPSLEAVMALQKMLEDGLLDQLDDSNEAPPLEARPPVDRPGLTRLADANRSVFQAVCCFFRDLAHRLYFKPVRKKPTGGKSASESR